MKKPIKSNLLVWILCIAIWGLAILFVVWLLGAVVSLESLDKSSAAYGMAMGIIFSCLFPLLLQPMLRFAKRFEEDESAKPPDA